VGDHLLVGTGKAAERRV